MFPNLMATDDNDDDIFPKTDRYLFLGGPEHGRYREVIKGDLTHKVIAPPTPAPFIAQSEPSELQSGFDIHTYVRRELGLQTDDGAAYKRDVYIHEAVPSPEVGQQLLMSALLAEFVKDGEKVTPDGVPNLLG